MRSADAPLVVRPDSGNPLDTVLKVDIHMIKRTVFHVYLYIYQCVVQPASYFEDIGFLST